MKTTLLAAAVALAVCLPAGAADESATGKIAWHGTWKGGLAVAQKTGQPILLISAAPHCHGTPGIW